ncbi:hypothetical protein Dsin_005801 [Dipteronia sinensis]|uniref:Uncharacterized protein n=1 Tax=Dipteronia sinensis TaxID=43782 RepID=A0AAE0EF90_9ROSI|nr:hypothetical protein Dsin_005801 [Dipteronia sinensis]
MVEKRPFDGEEIFEVSSKHARQDEHGNQLFSSSELVLPEDGPHISDTSGEATFLQSNIGFDKKLASDTFTEQGSTGDVETSGPGCIFNSSWPTSSTSEEDSRLETPIHVLYFSEYYNPERPTRTMAHCADIYSLLLDHPPRKPVPIGPNHQADIPACGSYCIKKTSNHVGTSEIVLGTEDIAGDEDEKVLMGTCVIPMPDLGQPSSYNDYQVGKGRIDCLCENGGSIRCVRQHIVEVREKLREYIGLGRFVELGFLDMGEIVADKWSDGEEQLFHNIVYSNPFTLGKKFWDILSIVFPSRSKMDIVSYYFNVFMLRRRAEQNRCYPVNIDSDNDEWQGSDDSGDNEIGMSDDDEDSVVESPAYHDDAGYIQNRKDFNVYEKDEACKNENAEFVCGTGITNISEASSGKLLNSNSSNLSSQVQENIPWDEKRDQEIQDDSCTSCDKNDRWPSNFNELSNGGVHEYVMESCDAKVWDAGYSSCHQNKVDLLPTCSMIEEVFGDGSWNCKAGDSKC